MARKLYPSSVGALTDVHTTAKNRLGTMVHGEGGSEFVYLKGLDSVAVGSWVTFDELGVVALLAANAVGNVAVAMGAPQTGEYGWYCVTSGQEGVRGACDDIADNKPMYIDGTSGRVDDAAVAGDLVHGVISRSEDAANLATFQINRPFVNDGGYLV